MKNLLPRITGLLIACALGAGAHAQTWPGKPIKNVVNFPPFSIWILS